MKNYFYTKPGLTIVYQNVSPGNIIYAVIWVSLIVFSGCYFLQ